MCAFDIETTRLEDIEQSIMYIWQFSILFLDDLHIDTIIGRTRPNISHFNIFRDLIAKTSSGENVYIPRKN